MLMLHVCRYVVLLVITQSCVEGADHRLLRSVAFATVTETALEDRSDNMTDIDEEVAAKNSTEALVTMSAAATTSIADSLPNSTEPPSKVSGNVNSTAADSANNSTEPPSEVAAVANDVLKVLLDGTASDLEDTGSDPEDTDSNSTDASIELATNNASKADENATDVDNAKRNGNADQSSQQTTKDLLGHNEHTQVSDGNMQRSGNVRRYPGKCAEFKCGRPGKHDSLASVLHLVGMLMLICAAAGLAIVGMLWCFGWYRDSSTHFEKLMADARTPRRFGRAVSRRSFEFPQDFLDP